MKDKTASKQQKKSALEEIAKKRHNKHFGAGTVKSPKKGLSTKETKTAKKRDVKAKSKAQKSIKTATASITIGATMNNNTTM